MREVARQEREGEKRKKQKEEGLNLGGAYSPVVLTMWLWASHLRAPPVGGGGCLYVAL